MAYELTKVQQTYAAQTVTKLNELKEKQGLEIPAGYNASSALQAAMFKINEVKAFEKATPDSIQESLLNMVVQGLEPQKSQAYFIVYGNTLQMQRSYFGTQAVLKRLPEIKDIKAYVVRDQEKFVVDYDENGELAVVEHNTSFEMLDNQIIGAYAIIYMADDTKRYEIMTKKQIDASWSKSRNNSVQKQFPEEMAKRTVINRAAKNIINTSTGNGALIQAINDTTAGEYENNPKDIKATEQSHDLNNLLNTGSDETKSEDEAKTQKEVEETKEQKVEEAPINLGENNEEFEEVNLLAESEIVIEDELPEFMEV